MKEINETLNSIINNIEKDGVIRPNNVILESVDNGIKYFKEIITEMCLMKDDELQWEPIEDIVEHIVKWSYQIGDNIDFKRGFLLKGHTGCGKTFLMKAWKYFLKIDRLTYSHEGYSSFLDPDIVNVKMIAGEYQHHETGGYGVIKRYSNAGCLVLDDIGKESEFSKSYGNTINIIEEIINIREERGLLTFGTTNENDLTKLYDDRTVSRMNRLFTAIPLNHKTDFRKI